MICGRALKGRLEVVKFAKSKYKLVGKGYGELRPRQAQLAPWAEIAVDLIGPWSIKIPPARLLTFSALTCIDTVTNFPE